MLLKVLVLTMGRKIEHVHAFITKNYSISVQSCGNGSCLTNCGKLFEVQAGAGLTQEVQTMVQ